MDTTRPTRSALIRGGVVVFGLAAVADVVAHAVGATAGLERAAHLATFLGMVLTLAAIVGTGVRRSPRPPTEGSSHAVR